MAVDAKQFAGGDKKFFQIGQVAGINTQAPRESIEDQQFSWLENIQPIGNNNFRALYSNGSAVYTTSNPRTIVYHYPFNFDGTNYIFVCLDDGTAVAVNSDTAVVTTITSATGTFYPGDPKLGSPLPQCAQVGQSGLAIVSTGNSGYSFWDNTFLYIPGGLAPGITITNNGAAYQTAPVVLILGGSGSGAAAVAQIQNGIVTSVTITNPGSGYKAGEAVTVDLVGGTLTGSGVAVSAVLSAIGGGSGATFTVHWTTTGFGSYFEISSITVTGGGSGYSALTTALWGATPGSSHWTSTGPTPVNFTIVAGVITAATPQNTSNHAVFNTGSGFPTLGTSDPSSFFTVTATTITAGGSSYSPTVTVVATGGGTPKSQATFKPVVTAGAISSIVIENGGVYGSNTPPTLTVTDTAITATATAMLMPFGIQGTCIEMYQDRAWVGNGPNIYFSASGNVNDFDVGDGAGAFASNDSFLKLEFTALKQTGSFLYLFADSSINVISNVQESGTPTVTTFNNQNVNPQIGTPWHNSVIAIGDSLIFANIQGVFKLTGGNVKKVSDDLDGIFLAATSTLSADTSITQPTAALMQLNDRLVYMLVVPVQGPLDGSPRTGLVMSDEQKWWVGSQDVTFTQVSTQEINSTIQAWGNSGTTLRKLFTTASGTLTKTWQSKMWSAEGPHTVKQDTRLFTMAIDKTSGGYTFSGTYDYRLEGTAINTVSLTVNNTNLTGSGSTNANARGNYVGLTLHTTKDDFVLVSHSLLYQEQSPMGG